MRSKICKAKRKDNKEWVEGYYFCMVHDDTRHEHHFIIPIGANLSKGTPIEQIQVEIDIDTLCDDTGLTDKNGREIWENDIVLEVQPSKRTFKITYDVDAFCIDGHNIMLRVRNARDKVEVVGNVFDNPELLEKAR